MTGATHSAAVATLAADLQVRARIPLFLMINTLEMGGSERQFCALANGVDRARFDVDLGCLRRAGSLVDTVDEILEFYPGKSFLTWQAQRSRMRLMRHLRGRHIQLAHSFDFYSNLMLIPTARIAGVPVVIGSQRQIGDLLTRTQFAAQAAVFRLCDVVVCNSKAAAERLVNAGVQKRKLVVIPNAIPDDLFAASVPALPRRADIVRICLIARMNSKAKNQQVFLRAAATIVRKFSNAQFVLVGDGPLRQDLERLTDDLGLRKNVIFLGERLDIPAVLAAMDGSVVASSSESLSNVILESMAAGVPVVATDIPGNREVVKAGNTGILVASGSVTELVAALEQLLSYPSLRQALSARAKRYAKETYNFDCVRQQYEDLYAQLNSAKAVKNP